MNAGLAIAATCCGPVCWLYAGGCLAAIGGAAEQVSRLAWRLRQAFDMGRWAAADSRRQRELLEPEGLSLLVERRRMAMIPVLQLP